jgi:hypothetical protein
VLLLQHNDRRQFFGNGKIYGAIEECIESGSEDWPETPRRESAFVTLDDQNQRREAEANGYLDVVTDRDLGVSK